MIAGCYSLDLYCDNVDHKAPAWPDKRGHQWGEFPHQYTGEFGADCMARAKLAGWKINRKTGAALCPNCNPASPKFVTPPPA